MQRLESFFLQPFRDQASNLPATTFCKENGVFLPLKKSVFRSKDYYLTVLFIYFLPSLFTSTKISADYQHNPG